MQPRAYQVGNAPKVPDQIRTLGLHGASVVVVDDQDFARTALAGMIRGIDPGVSTSAFESAAEALVWLEKNEADLVITDYRMPGMNGAELVATLRGTPRLQYLPVMVVTAADDRKVRYEALEAGAVDFLSKPVDPLEVRTRCRNLLLLSHQYRMVKEYSLRQEEKLAEAQALLRALTPANMQSEDLAASVERGELLTVSYDRLFAITSCVAGAQELVNAAHKYIGELEGQLMRPLRGGSG